MWTSGFDAIELTRAVHPPATAKLISFVGMTSGPALHCRADENCIGERCSDRQLTFAALWLRANEPAPWLNIVVEMELVRMRAQPDGVDLLFPLVVEPGFDHVGSEHIAA